MKAKIDHNTKEDFKEAGLLGIFQDRSQKGLIGKGRRALDDLAGELISRGIIEPAPDNIVEGDWLLELLQKERYKHKVTIEQLQRVDDIMADQERDALERLKEGLRDDGKTEEEIERIIRGVQDDIEKEEDDTEAYFSTEEEIELEEDPEGYIYDPLDNMLLCDDTSCLPVKKESIPENWKGKLFKDYLSEKGMKTFPANPWEIEDYVDYLKDLGYKPTTIVSIMTPVRKMYRRIGIETKGIVRGPKNRMTFLKDPVSEEDTGKLLKYVNERCKLRDRLIVKLMVYLGLRDIEITRMDVGDFFKQDGDYIVKLWRKGHNGKDKQKKVVNGLLSTFLEYHSQKLSCKPEDPMFIGSKGSRLHPTVVSRIVRQIMEKAGVKNSTNYNRITPHSLRHTAITKIAKETKNLLLTQEFADHEDPRITRVYMHNIESPETMISWEDNIWR